MRGMIHLEKSGIRALGVAESFKKDKKHSIIAGVVMRSDFIIDGIAFDYITIRGDDATDAIIRLYTNLDRNDINLVMLNGLIISMYNIIDIDMLYQHMKIPIIGLTFEESKGLDEHIMRAFPDDYHKKLEAYHKLGMRDKLSLKTGYMIYVRFKGIRLEDVKRAIDKFLIQGSIPEPIRVAKLIARAYMQTLTC